MTAGGIGLGTAYAFRYKKGFLPMVMAGAVGSSADMIYGYGVACQQYRRTDDNSTKEE